MNTYHVVLAVARGARLDSGRKLRMTITASGPLRTALVAEHLAPQALGEAEDTHAQQVRRRPPAPTLALAP